MKSSSSGRDLQSLLEAIKASDVVENRVQLLNEIEELQITEKTEVTSLLEALNIFWEDFTCLDISQCILNKTILSVAAKHLETDISGLFEQLIILCTKASIWCGKHLKMTLMSTEDSPEEEHSGVFYQFLVDLLSFSASSISTLAKYPISCNKESQIMFETFIFEQLNLTKEVLMETKNIPSLGPELQKQAHSILDSTIRLCKIYSSSINWDIKLNNDSEEAKSINHVTNIIKYTIEKLCELGILAANDGGTLVSVLNLSWKGVVTLLQIGKGTLSVKINVSNIILTLISLVKQSLQCAANNWMMSSNEVSVSEAKRIFLPVKFYLINAVRIITQYPSQAFTVYKEISLCVIIISTFNILLSKNERFRSCCDSLTETLEPTSLHLLNSLLTQVNYEEKLRILDCLFSYEQVLDENEIFTVTTELMSRVKKLLPGRVIIFLNLLKSGPDLEEVLTFGLSKKLNWFFDVIMDEDIYSLLLQTKVKLNHSNQTMVNSITQSLKTFIIVVYSTQGWEEVESFLLENLFHPHFICYEIITELWCFILRHSDLNLVNDLTDKLCSLLECITVKESSTIRKITRTICLLANYGSQIVTDRVYNYIFSNYSSSLYISLLIEGFPLNNLSEKTKSLAKQRIVTDYFDYLENFDTFDNFGSPVFCLSAALQSKQVSVTDTDEKTLKFLIEISRKYQNCEEKSVKDQYRVLISEILVIISKLKNLYSCDEMEKVILELRNLCISKPALSDKEFYKCKPNLTYFMAGLGDIELSESEDNAKSIAIWELYHMLLKEKHWAFVHLAVSAFGYFAERTKCDQLWRFVPNDAALSFDLENGNVIEEDKFMNELKVYLEKEIKDCENEYDMLVKEGLIVKESLSKIDDFMEIDYDEGEKQGNRKRKLRDEISKGVELLQNGLKVMSNGLSQVESVSVHDKFMSQFVHLEDVIAHLVNLADDDAL